MNEKGNTDTTAVPAETIYGVTLARIDGTQQSLSEYRGKVLLVTNTASKCGYTGQYEGLERLQRKFGPEGLVVLGFPSNDFGGQEPGTNSEIATFCTTGFGVTFPLFAKSSVTGAAANPLFSALAKTRGAPTWNFFKYLIDRHGIPVASYPSGTLPEELEAPIRRELSRPGN